MHCAWYYDWNTVENGVKHHTITQLSIVFGVSVSDQWTICKVWSTLTTKETVEVDCSKAYGTKYLQDRMCSSPMKKPHLVLTLTTVLNLKKAHSKCWDPSILRTLSTTAKNSDIACVYFSWISFTSASRLILPAPPISAAPANKRKCLVVSTSSRTSLHLK